MKRTLLIGCLLLSFVGTGVAKQKGTINGDRVRVRNRPTTKNSETVDYVNKGDIQKEIYKIPDIPKNRLLYRMSDVCDVRQLIAPKGLTYFCAPHCPYMPFFMFLEDTKDHMFAVYTTHLNVFYKKEKYWQIFTYSDGFMPIRQPVKHFANYERYFAVQGRHYYLHNSSSTRVNIFDKSKGTTFSISSKEYKEFKRNWKIKKYKNKLAKWYVKDFNIIRENIKNKQKAYYSSYKVGFNNISNLASFDNTLVVPTANAIRVFTPLDSSKYFDSTNGLFSNSIREIKIYNKKILVLYDSQVDIFDIAGEFQISKTKHLSLSNTKINHITFDDKYLFYSYDNHFIAEDIKTRNQVYRIKLNANIARLDYFNSMVIIQTFNGFSVLNVKNMTIEHFLNNQQRDDSSEDYECGEYPEYAFNWVGLVNGNYIGVKKGYNYNMPSSSNSVVVFDINSIKIINDYSKILSKELENIVVDASYVHIFDDYVISKTKNKDSYSVYSLTNRGMQKIKEFNLGNQLNNKYLPNAFQYEFDFPIGNRINHSIVLKDILWIATDKGLFSYSIKEDQWKSYFVARSDIFNIMDLSVSEEGIYFHIGTSGSDFARDWTRIDRHDFKIKQFDSQQWEARKGTFKTNKDTLIYATKYGIGYYNFKTKINRIIKTPESIGQVAFYKNYYIAANEYNVYVVAKDGELIKDVKLSEPFGKDKFQQPPEILEVDGNNIWMSKEGRILICNIKSGKQKEIQLEYNPRIIKIIPDKNAVWIFLTDQIYKYDKASGVVSNLGSIESPRAASSCTMIDVLDNGESLYIMSSTGIYELDKKSYSLKINNSIRVVGPFFPISIVQYNKLFFLGIGHGILQIEKKSFEQGFVKCDKRRDYFYRQKIRVGDSVQKKLNRKSEKKQKKLTKIYILIVILGIAIALIIKWLKK